VLQLWDIMSGRVVKDGWRHEGRITGMEFHPAEFLLATSGADKTVRVWDLETWEQVESLGPEATGVQAIAYHRDGRALLSATADALKVWGTEPAVHHDTVHMDWRHLMDLHMSYKDDAPRAVGCCASGSSVGVFLVDLRKVAPFCRAGAAGSKAAAGGGIGSGGRAAQQLLPGYSRGVQQAGKQLEGANDTSGSDKSAGNRAAAAEQEGPALAGPLTRQLPRQRTPPKPIGPGTGSNGSSSRPGSRGTGLQGTPPFLSAAQPGQLVTPESQGAQQQHKQHQQEYFPDVEIRVPARRPSSAGLEQQRQEQPAPASSTVQAAAPSRNSDGAAGSTRPASGSSSSRLAAYEPDLPLVSPMAGLSLQQQESQAANGQQQARTSSSSSSRRQAGLTGGASRSGCSITAGAAAAASAPVSRGASRSSSAVASRAASAHDLGSGMQQQAQQQQQQSADVADPILAAMASRPQLKGSLARMGAALQVAKGFVGRGNLEGAYRAALSQGDAAIAAMLLASVSGRADAFELSSLEPLIKLLELLLASGQEQQVAVGLSTLGLVLRGPGQVVAEVCGGPQPVGVDLSYEARRSKCLLLKMALEGLGMKLGVLGRSSSSSSAVAARAQLLGEELRRIVAAGS
jgi:hypothetical protein